jgi:hypothetical protein
MIEHNWDWPTIWNALSAIAGAGVCVLTVITLRQIKSDSDARERFNRAEARAYINVEIEFSHSPIGGGPSHLTARINVSNYGDTPAKDVEIYGNIIRHIGYSELKDDGYQTPYNPNPQAIIKGGMRQIILPDVVHPDIMTDLRDPNKTLTLCVLGRVFYKDVFGTHWVHKYAWEIIWDESGLFHYRKTLDWNNEYVKRG